jgi:hypothetical protein
MTSRMVTAVVPWIVAFAAVTSPAPAAAQPRERGTVSLVAGALTTSADAVDGTRPSLGVAASIVLTPWLDLEGELAATSGVLRRDYTGSIISLAPPGSPPDVVDANAVITRTTNERRTDFLFSIGVLAHPAPSATRLRPHAFLGLTGHRVSDRRRLEHLVIPPGYTRADVDRILPPEAPWRRNVGGLTFGAGVAMALTRRLAIVPDIRFNYGSFADEINNALHSTLRVRWRF